MSNVPDKSRKLSQPPEDKTNSAGVFLFEEINRDGGDEEETKANLFKITDAKPRTAEEGTAEGSAVKATGNTQQSLFDLTRTKQPSNQPSPFKTPEPEKGESAKTQLFSQTLKQSSRGTHGAIERNGLAPGANQRKMFDSEQVTLPKPVHVASIEALELFEEPKQDGDKAKESTVCDSEEEGYTLDEANLTKELSESIEGIQRWVDSLKERQIATMTEHLDSIFTKLRGDLVKSSEIMYNQKLTDLKYLQAQNELMKNKLARIHAWNSSLTTATESSFVG